MPKGTDSFDRYLASKNISVLESLDVARRLVQKMTNSAKLLNAAELDELRIRLNIVRSYLDPEWLGR